MATTVNFRFKTFGIQLTGTDRRGRERIGGRRRAAFRGHDVQGADRVDDPQVSGPADREEA